MDRQKGRKEGSCPFYRHFLIQSLLFISLPAWSFSFLEFENRSLGQITPPSVVSSSTPIPEWQRRGEGGSDAGGGLGEGLELLDFAEARQGGARVPFNPSDLKILQKSLKMELEKGLEKDPSFQHFIFDQFKSGRRNWFFVNGALDQYLDTSNLHILMETKNKQVVAIQTKFTVLINLKWLLTVGELEQQGLFVHEALMTVALDYGLPHDNVRDMTRTVFAHRLGGSFPNNFELLLNQLGFLLPYQDYLKQVGENFLVYRFHNAAHVKAAIVEEEAGGNEFIRIDPWPNGQSKVVFRVLPPGALMKELNTIEVTETPISLPSYQLLWSGYPTVTALTPLKWNIKQFYIYRRLK